MKGAHFSKALVTNYPTAGCHNIQTHNFNGGMMIGSKEPEQEEENHRHVRHHRFCVDCSVIEYGPS
jgi:hypothetical protein